MRITLEIDDDLLAAAMRATDLPSHHATIEAPLRRFVVECQREAIAAMAGTGWVGDLDAMHHDD